MKSSCSIKHINFIDQHRNWIQMSESLKHILFYSDKLYLVEKGNFIPFKSIFTSMKSGYGFQNDHQPNKTVAAFSSNSADLPTLTPLPPIKPFLIISVFHPINLFIIFLLNLFINLIHLPLNLSLLLFVNLLFLIHLQVLGMSVYIFLEIMQSVKLL